jgi:hypothetical protein
MVLRHSFYQEDVMPEQGDGSSGTDGNTKVARLLTETRAEIEDLKKHGNQLRWSHNIFTALVIVAGVAAPAAVTYAGANHSFILLAIGLSALVSAAASLRSTFRWGERYGSVLLTAAGLEELCATLELAVDDVLLTNTKQAAPYKLGEIVRSAYKTKLEIKRRYLESETAALARPVEPPAPPPPDRAAGGAGANH